MRSNSKWLSPRYYLSMDAIFGIIPVVTSFVVGAEAVGRIHVCWNPVSQLVVWPILLSSTLLQHHNASVARLHCAARGDLLVPWTRHLGNWAFCVAGPAVWNSLSLDIQTASTAATFKKLLNIFVCIVVLCLNYCFCKVRVTDVVRHPCSDSGHVVAPYKLSYYYYCYFYCTKAAGVMWLFVLSFCEQHNLTKRTN